MKTRRLTVVALPALVAASLAAAGCGAQSNTAAPAASGSASPAATSTASTSAGSAAAKATLAESVTALGSTSYKYRLTSAGFTGDGSADAVSKSTSATLTGAAQGNSVKVDVVAVNTDFWIKLNLGSGGSALGISTDKWMHVDAARLGTTSTLPIDPSGGAAAANSIMGALKDVTQVDPTHYSGTIDLTKVTGMSGVSPDTLKSAGVKATAVPFTASVDTQNRLTDLKLDLASVDSSLSPFEVSYSDYGVPVTVTKPAAADVTEAPDTVYQLFGH